MFAGFLTLLRPQSHTNPNFANATDFLRVLINFELILLELVIELVYFYFQSPNFVSAKSEPVMPNNTINHIGRNR